MSLAFYYFLAVTAIYILMSWALYLPYRVGQLHFMSIANMAIAGYFGAYAAKIWYWPFAAVFVAAILIGALTAFITSLAIGDAPCFAVVIVGFTYIFISKTVIENWDALGGTVGFFGIPDIDGLLWIAYIFVAAVGGLIYRFDHSRLGRAASAIFVDKDLAVSFGVNVKKLGMLLQTVSGAIGGACGLFYAFFMNSLFPEFFTFHMIGTCMTMLFVGGFATMWGVLLSAPLLWGIPLLFPPAIASWRIVIYGVLLIIVLVLRPEGIITRQFVHKIEIKLSKMIKR